MTEPVVLIPRRLLVGALVAAIAATALAVAVFLPGPREAVAGILTPRAMADAATIAQQRTFAEHSIQRGHAKASGQLTQVRALTLAIGRAEADAIEDKARADLAEIRRQALAALAGVLGVPAPLVPEYVASTEASLQRDDFASEPGILLAPGLSDIVRRADQLYQSVADDATRQLTRAPATPSPSASASPSPAPRPSATTGASPSPTGR